MGFMSRFSVSARKEEAVASIETYYAICKRHGVFPGDPAETARIIVAVACAQQPDIAARQQQPFVLATTCLTIMLMEQNERREIREHFAMALLAMIKAARQSSTTHTYAEKKYIELGEIVYKKFRTAYPAEQMYVTF